MEKNVRVVKYSIGIQFNRLHAAKVQRPFNKIAWDFDNTIRTRFSIFCVYGQSSE